MTHTRLDIENTIGTIAIFQVDIQVDPKGCHYAAVKRISKYLKGTFDYGIWYDRSSDFTLCSYIDADWAGNMDNIKNISGGPFFLGGRLVSWLRKKQYCIS